MECVRSFQIASNADPSCPTTRAARNRTNRQRISKILRFVSEKTLPRESALLQTASQSRLGRIASCFDFSSKIQPLLRPQPVRNVNVNLYLYAEVAVGVEAKVELKVQVKSLVVSSVVVSSQVLSIVPNGRTKKYASAVSSAFLKAMTSTFSD